MRVDVDLDLCQVHGQCEFAAPDVFVVHDDGSVEWEAAPPESQRTAVQQAVRLCPVQAIKIQD